MLNAEKRQILRDIEKAFGDIKKKKDVDGSLRKIKTSLYKLDIVIDEITIVPADKDDFFGMSVYPTHETADKIVEAMLENKPLEAYQTIWGNNDKWIIEIDSKLLYDKKLNANPAEITAALLHEIGHVVYSNSIPTKLHKSMSLTFLQLPYSIKVLLKNTKATWSSIFLPVVAQASSTPSYSLKKELDADKYAAAMGYGDALSELLRKIVQTYNSSLVEDGESSMDKDLGVACRWATEQACQLEVRRDRLKNSIDTITLASPSKYTREIFQAMNVKLFRGVESTQSLVARRSRGAYVTEGTASIDLEKGVAMTAMLESAKKKFFDKTGHIKKISQQDIDILEIEAERIETQDDKIYILDVAYGYLEQLELMKEYLKSKDKKTVVPMSEKQIDNMITQLYDLRKRVLDIRIVDKQYGLFIKYPVGYEG